MIEYTTRYDVKKTMYEKFADSAAQHTNEPCFIITTTQSLGRRLKNG